MRSKERKGLVRVRTSCSQISACTQLCSVSRVCLFGRSWWISARSFWSPQQVRSALACYLFVKVHLKAFCCERFRVCRQSEKNGRRKRSDERRSQARCDFRTEHNLGFGDDATQTSATESISLTFLFGDVIETLLLFGATHLGYCH